MAISVAGRPALEAFVDALKRPMAVNAVSTDPDASREAGKKEALARVEQGQPLASSLNPFNLAALSLLADRYFHFFAWSGHKVAPDNKADLEAALHRLAPQFKRRDVKLVVNQAWTKAKFDEMRAA